MLVSYAQNFEDIVLWRALKEVGAGRYVDVGAADPVVDSVTKLFYDRGWSGLNIEPVSELAARLIDARPRDVTVEACAGATSGSVVLHQVPSTGLSTIDDASAAALAGDYAVEDVVVPLRPLREIVDEQGFGNIDVHFLKIDVESYEEDVLRGVDFAAWRPWVVVVEATLPRRPEPSHHTWEHLLTDNGYRFTLFDGLNRFYVADEHLELERTLSYPVCVFDHPYATAPQATLMAEHQRLAARCGDLERLTTDMSETLDQLRERLDAAHLSNAQIQERVDAATAEIVELRTALAGADARADAAERSERVCREQLAAQASEHLAVVSRNEAAVAAAWARQSTLAARVVELEASTSWRLTRPLRYVGDAIRRATREGRR